MGTLFLVATPIGNLEDITLRGLRVLREVPLIAAEDTRSTRSMLRHYGIEPPPMVSYTDHNASARTPGLLKALATGDVALISDAGMPGISDPGHHLVAAAIEAGNRVEPVPGASAVVAAVAASGLASRRFHYLGFLPRTSGARKEALRRAGAIGDTLVVYESPHRLRPTLEDIRTALGDRRIAVCRELTKVYEEIWRGTVSDALAHFTEPRGEFTLVVEGGPPVDERSNGRAGADEAIVELRSAGITSKDAVAELSRRFGISRREAYRRWHQG